jgi:arsenate reductase
MIVCERTERECPKLFPGAVRRYFWPFPDPVAVEGGADSRLNAFRKLRDAIQRRVLDWLREREVGEIEGVR